METLGSMPWRRLLVRGPSMSPTLRDGDVVVVSLRSRVRVRDLVVVRWLSRPQQLSVKRALSCLDEGWHVEGDNPFGSTDSRELGPATVLGVVRWRLWPEPGRVR